MKKVLSVLTVVFFLSASLLASNGISFEKNLSKAFKKAKKENKIVFVDAYTTWCGPCKWMSANVFTDDKVANFYNENFINLKLDMEEGEGIDFLKKYNVQGFPTLLYLDSSGAIMHKAMGARDANGFIDLGEIALNPTKRLSYFVDNYEEKKDDADFLLAYAQMAREAGMRNYRVIGNEYLEHIENWLQDTTTAVFTFNFMDTDVASNTFKYVAENKEKFYNYIPEARVDKVIATIIVNSMEDNSSDKQISEALMMKFPIKGERMIADIRLDNLVYSSDPKDLKEFAEFAIGYVEKYNIQDAAMLNNIAWHYYEFIDEKKYLEKAAMMVERSVENSSDYFNNDTAAAVFYKLKQKDKALFYANQAIELAKTSNSDFTETAQMLIKIEALD